MRYYKYIHKPNHHTLDCLGYNDFKGKNAIRITFNYLKVSTLV